jgi:uncharacterized protein YbaR (Trm112 family)
MTIDPELLAILVCPKCRSDVTLNDAQSELLCTDSACGLVYPVREGIPVMLIDEARGSLDAG